MQAKKAGSEEPALLGPGGSRNTPAQNWYFSVAFTVRPGSL